VDAASLPAWLQWFARIAVPLAAILISVGFFLSVASPDALRPNGAVSILYVGAMILALGVLTLGVGLLRSL
jgi:hypothetical protein